MTLMILEAMVRVVKFKLLLSYHHSIVALVAGQVHTPGVLPLSDVVGYSCSLASNLF